MPKYIENKENDFEIKSEVVKDLIKNFNSITFPVAILQNLSETIKRNADAIKMASKIFDEQRTVITNFVNGFNQYFAKIKELQDFTEEVAKAFKYKKQRRDVILKSGWWLTPSIMRIPAGLLTQAFTDYDKVGKIAITRLFVSVYEGKKCRYLVEVIREWQKNKYFRPWESHLEQALNAHIKGEYNLSIPVLLLVAEGIAKNYCKDKKISFNWAKGNDKITKALEKAGYDDEEIEKNLYMLEIDLFFASIDDKIYQNTSLLKKTRGFRYILNRHAVLHGITSEYGTRKNSLQGFMLLDVLSLLK
ncbi:MAG: hypothetical protein UR66_C0010G0023 [Candidatus Moranbacteria bacterium GW2011_GWE1_35_17]|nr:MAG: hypothetical protein UR66_C0010G0023 [Candidatus Moranbacteria bacterium GW2011_GWE1_35_17]KKP67842.1 MAG: hypothetical protein UR65_C0065G0008 [Candidatus Moranbacteria bacterium GW2011_GWE2_35_164]KKP83681.1 MAG: hypothetical protein UR82_C0019G0009 [Candidatus Moranbacteria bacterium GW2011_GWF1_35_5]KKP83920.1 MAG: hypothetical protein UR83_C0030G0004 [Candidatus Moranbacteria bacterium GW2011_GWF2_35_54]